MIRYNITRIAATKTRRAPGSRVLLPKIEERLGAVRSYKAILRRMLASLAAEVRRTVIPAYRYQQTFTRDAPEDTFEQMRAVAAMLSAAATRAVEGILSLEAIKHTETFIDVARKTLGIDISAVVTQEDIADYLRTAAARNASLIKSLADDTVKKVEQAVLQNTLAGNSVKTLTERLVKDFGVSQTRAELIAADQSAKLTSDLNRIRQQQAEIEKYEWSTSHDERVRPLHQAIGGTEYKWGESTGAEGGLPPGQPIRCRCVARGIVKF